MMEIMGFIDRMFRSAIERVIMHGDGTRGAGRGRIPGAVHAAGDGNFPVDPVYPVDPVAGLGRASQVPAQPLDPPETADGSELEEVCRICHGSQGRLRSLCGCRGSVRLVHEDCLKKWLAVSGSSSCELCRRGFLLGVEPRYWLLQSVWVWLSTKVSPWQIVTSKASWLVDVCVCHLVACWLASAVRKGENQLVDPQHWQAPAVAGLLRLLVRVYQLERGAMLLQAAVWLVHSWYLWWLTTFEVSASDPLAADTSSEDID